jgi:hypothetical protein
VLQRPLENALPWWRADLVVHETDGETPGRDARPIRDKGRHPQIRPSAAWLGHHDSMARDVPVQYFQSIITVLLAVAGALLFQVRFFDLTHSERTKEVDPLLRLVMMAVITATLFASLEAMREGWGPLAAALVTIGLALSLLPILLRVLPPLTRDLTRDLKTEQRDPHLWVTVLGLILYCAIVTTIVWIV